MRRLISLALLLGALGSQNAEADTVTFANVNVIPMDDERVLRRQTVVIRGGRIAQLGSSAQVKAPKDSMVIDGRGKFLMPGFAEMHGHLPGPDTDPETVDRILYLFLANGVTTVRGMLGQPNHLELRKEIEEGQRLGPTLYVAGPPFQGGSNRRRGPQPSAGAKSCWFRPSQSVGRAATSGLRRDGGDSKPGWHTVWRTRPQ